MLPWYQGICMYGGMCVEGKVGMQGISIGRGCSIFFYVPDCVSYMYA